MGITKDQLETMLKNPAMAKINPHLKPVLSLENQPVKPQQTASAIRRDLAKRSAGWRVIGGVRKYYRSKMEANYARYLQFLLQTGLIKAWEHEPTTFWFEAIKRGVRSYKPDFKVTKITGGIIYYEVKGWMDPKSKTKLKRMAKYYPNIELILIKKDWFATALRLYAVLIPDLEH